MNKFSYLSCLALLLMSCTKVSPSSQIDASPSELSMAEAMGISVEELRNQTPEEHMKMMQMMMHSDHSEQQLLEIQTLSPYEIAALPAAKATQTYSVSNGDTIALHPTLVRKTLNGSDIAMYGYNEQIPGPFIQAPQGATITVEVTNALDTETTIHWHGIRLNNVFDGVPHVSQDPISSGETYRYTITFPDEGIYWYHPHIREDIQQDMGLYGNILVHPEGNSEYSPVHDTQAILLDDLLINDEGNIVPYGIDAPNFALMGRFGNIILMNGVPAPEYSYHTNRGSITRFYLTNVANTRTFNIRIDGGRMKRVGSDVGRYEQEEWVDTITIAPAERYIVDVLFEDDGIYNITHETPEKTIVLGTVTVDSHDADPSFSSSFYTLKTHNDVIKDINTYRPYFTSPPDKTLLLDITTQGMMAGMDHGSMHHNNTGIEWEDTMPHMNASMRNDEISWKLIDQDTGRENMNIDWNFSQGDIVKIRIINKDDSDHPMQHPLHLHGQRFLVLEQDGVVTENLVWKDTVLVPTGSTVDILVDMSNPGTWMMHCHIAEHLSNGMMGMFTVQ